MRKLYFCGFNGFHQFGAAHGKKVSKATEFFTIDDEKRIKFTASWSFNCLAIENELNVSGFSGNKDSISIKKVTNHPIVKIDSNEDYCLVLLENGEVWILNPRTGNFDKIEFHDERPFKRNISGSPKENPRSGVVKIKHIACGRKTPFIWVAISENNVVFNIYGKFFEFPKHEKLDSLVCGFEHSLVLNKNGDVYSWGNGLRGQLGFSDLKVQDTPELIEALSGVKIICISAGGWHNVALSTFGDIYTWGWNINGQLGLKMYSQNSPTGGQNLIKNPTVFNLPHLIDEWTCCENVNEEHSCTPLKVICGDRHTIIQNSCGKLLCTGWNEHGQLGMENIGEEPFVDNFVEMKDIFFQPSEVFCGAWCTVIME